MKRSAALTPLSHDHQHALDAALRLRRADDESLADAVGRFEHFFATEGSRHFEIEERLLLPALPDDDPEWAPAVARVLDDHAAIRLASRRLGSVDDARALGERLNEHVRFEERVLFEIAERRLGTAELAALGEAIAAAEAE